LKVIFDDFLKTEIKKLNLDNTDITKKNISLVIKNIVSEVEFDKGNKNLLNDILS
jgi:hypothetical protein